MTDETDPRLLDITSQREIDLMTPMLESLDPASAHEVSGGRVEWTVKSPTSTSSLWLVTVLGLGIILVSLSLMVGSVYSSKVTPTISEGND